MLFFDGAFGLALLALWLFCLIDVIMTDAERCRNLQKPLWLLLVLLLFDIGAVLWLVAGRPWERTGRSRGYQTRPPAAYPEYDRPGRFAASNPDDDEDFLRQVRERAEEQRRRYREQQEEDRAKREATGQPSDPEPGDGDDERGTATPGASTDGD